MKWYNKDKTKCLDLDSVSFWEYRSKEFLEAELGERPEFIRRLFPVETYLNLVTGGCQISFTEEEADEIYNILRNQKTVLHS